MRKIDQLIREALREEDAELLKRAGSEPSLYQEGLDLFRGRSRWMGFLSVCFMIIVITGGIYTAVRFFHAVTTRAMLAWAMGFLICMLGATTIKVWAWIEMSKNGLAREIKRLELQVAMLASRIGGNGANEV